MTSSSPASRPSPPGGLRPAQTPAPGEAPWHRPGAGRLPRSTNLKSLRFQGIAEAGHGALVLGPVGVGKTHLASALRHIAIRRRMTVHAARADKLFTRLRASRLDTTLEAELRKLARVDLLILDDFALKPLDATQTNDF